MTVTMQYNKSLIMNGKESLYVAKTIVEETEYSNEEEGHIAADGFP